jgi:hypothetical protein
MNKIFYTLSFLLFFSFFNNEAKAQSSDISACTLSSGAVNVTSIATATDKTCDTTGATKLTLKLHNLGFCTSAPTIKFATGGKIRDERDYNDDSYGEGDSDFSSCTWTIKQTTATDEILETVGEVEPLPLDELPPKGTYTHAVIVVSNVVKVQGYTQFSTAIADTTSSSGNSGTYCWTNGAEILEVGRHGPKITPPSGSQGALNYGGGAKCGTLAQAQAQQAENTITYMMNNLRDLDEFNCSDLFPTGTAPNRGDCNTTRSVENTTLGTLDLYYTKVTSFTVPTIHRATLTESTKGAAATEAGTSNADSITMVFGFNNPIVVTDKTTGMDIKINYNYALSVDFEDVKAVGGDGTLIDNDTAVTKRIRLLGAGPFGIAFVPNEGGSTD